MLPNKINRMDDGKGSHGVIYLCHEIGPRQRDRTAISLDHALSAVR